MQNSRTQFRYSGPCSVRSAPARTNRACITIIKRRARPIVRNTIAHSLLFHYPNLENEWLSTDAPVRRRPDRRQCSLLGPELSNDFILNMLLIALSHHKRMHLGPAESRSAVHSLSAGVCASAVHVCITGAAMRALHLLPGPGPR